MYIQTLSLGDTLGAKRLCLNFLYNFVGWSHKPWNNNWNSQEVDLVSSNGLCDQYTICRSILYSMQLYARVKWRCVTPTFFHKKTWILSSILDFWYNIFLTSNRGSVMKISFFQIRDFKEPCDQTKNIGQNPLWNGIYNLQVRKLIVLEDFWWTPVELWFAYTKKTNCTAYCISSVIQYQSSISISLVSL